jgi:hypothetical protein
MANKIRITSDGTAAGTKVFACGIGADGSRLGADVELTGIARIELLPIEPRAMLEVKITFINVEVDVLADPVA